jgi:hypothetical protein
MSALYRDSGIVLSEIISAGKDPSAFPFASLKALCFHRGRGQPKLSNGKAVFALVSETLKIYDPLRRALERTILIKKGKGKGNQGKGKLVHDCTVTVMARDLLSGGRITGGGQLKKSILAEESKLRRFYKIVQAKAKAIKAEKASKELEESEENGNKNSNPLPQEENIEDKRIGRVNTLLSTVSKSIKVCFSLFSPIPRSLIPPKET